MNGEVIKCMSDARKLSGLLLHRGTWSNFLKGGSFPLRRLVAQSTVDKIDFYEICSYDPNSKF